MIGPMRTGVTLVVTVLLVMVLASCSGSSKSAGRSPSTTAATTAPAPETVTSVDPATSTTTDPKFCGTTQDGCTPTQMLNAVMRYYEIGGATPAEAACLAPIVAYGKQSLAAAFDRESTVQDQASAKCVGSEARLIAITTKIGDLLLGDASQSRAIGRSLRRTAAVSARSRAGVLRRCRSPIRSVRR